MAVHLELSDLTVPEPESRTARDVLSRAMGRLLPDLKQLNPALATGAPLADAVRELRRMLARQVMVEPGAAFAVLSQPTVAVFLRCLRGAAPGAETDRWLVGFLAAAGLALAHAEALPGPVRVPGPPSVTPCLSGGYGLRAPEGTRELVLENGRATFVTSSGPVTLALEDGEHELREPCYHTIDGDLRLALHDDNPLAMSEAHPDKSGNAVDLGGHTADAWVRALRDALSTIEMHLPELRAEMDLFVRQVVPVGYDEQRHLSASYREALGTVYISLHPQMMTLAEALVHEHQHQKLNALLELDDVLENGRDAVYASPVRPDPRPLWGVLLAVHAFLPVARLYERMREAGHPRSKARAFAVRYDAIVDNNRQGAAVLVKHARPTPAGRQVLDEIARLTR